MLFSFIINQIDDVNNNHVSSHIKTKHKNLTQFDENQDTIMLKLFIALAVISVCYADKYTVNFGPSVKATKGEVWPKPQRQEKFNDYFILHPHKFSFKVTETIWNLLQIFNLNNFQEPSNIGCSDFLVSALKRYWNIIANSGSLERRGRFLERGQGTKTKKLRSNRSYIGILSSLKIELTGKCENENILPKLEDDENCK